MHWIHFWTIKSMLSDRGHAKDVHFVGEHFSTSYRFCLWKSDPLMEIFKNFAKK